MPNLKQQVGGRIKMLRTERGLTQAKLAEKVGVSLNMIGSIERGEKFTSAETLQKLATALKVTAEDLFIFERELSPEELEKQLLSKRLNELLSDTPTAIVRIIGKILKDFAQIRPRAEA